MAHRGRLFLVLLRVAPLLLGGAAWCSPSSVWVLVFLFYVSPYFCSSLGVSWYAECRNYFLGSSC